MDAEHWRQTSQLYHAALLRAVPDRAAFVREACGGDDALRREVESLLALDASAQNFLNAPAADAAARLMTDVPHVALIGRQVGTYRVVSLLGAGGMGEVYRARDTKLGRDVAIKILPNVFVADADRLARFEREARMLASLNHPHIGAIYGLETVDGIPALVLELIDGVTLADRLAKGPLPVRDALTIAVQIADALEAAHEKGIVHRDLKPANIKSTPDGTVKVLDFGLAKAAAGDASTPDLSRSPTMTVGGTREGTILGTAAYMSPEQARGHVVDKRTDIWAFGCVLYEMLTGRAAFFGDTISDTIVAILEREPAWAVLPVTTPTRVQKLLRRCLDKNPKRRVHDIADARIEIEDELATSSLDGETVAALPAATPGSRRRERLAWVAFAVLGAAVATTLVVSYLRRPVTEPAVTRLDLVTPPTADPFSFALSPDGRQIVYVATAEGVSKLWLRPLDQTRAQPLAGTEGASAPFWAPDGRALGFFADSVLKRIDLTGGAPEVLYNAPTGRGGTWNRDGVIVFAGGSQNLMRVTATGGTATPVGRLARGQSSHRWPQFLPDGQRFLFFAQGTPATQGVYVGSLDGGEPTRVLAAATAAAYAPPGYLLFVSQGVLMARAFDAARGVVSGDPLPVAPTVGVDTGGILRGAFTVSSAGVLAHRSSVAFWRQLVWFDRTGKELGALGPAEDTGLSVPQLSPDGHQVAVHRAPQGNGDVWLIDVTRGLASRFTFDPAVDAAPLWSPDGSQIIFRSDRNHGRSDLFTRPADSSADERPLLATAQDKSAMDWSSDGRVLLYTSSDPKTQSDLWALPLTGLRPSIRSASSSRSTVNLVEPSTGLGRPEPAEGRTPFPFVQTSFDEGQGQFSPDGRWVAYASNETGRYEVYVRPFPGPGGKWRASTGGGIYPRWRRDGEELFYLGLDNRLMAVPITVAPDARTLTPGAPIPLFRTRLAIGGNTGVGGYLSRALYAVAPDGRFLMVVTADDAAASPITIVQNWAAGLKP